MFFGILIILFLECFELFLTGELILLSTVTRHGKRSPCNTYANDPYKNVWTKGLCQLTDAGEIQLQEFGSFLRKEYSNFIPLVFNKKQVYIRSSDCDRTITSGMNAMKTLFPNQTIPIHTVPKIIDYQLKMTSHCPYHYKLLINHYNNKENQQLLHKYSQLFQLLQNVTNESNINYEAALKLCDVIEVWYIMKMKLPEWCDYKTIIEPCIKFRDLKFFISYSNKQLTKYRGGPLIEMILDHMFRETNNVLNNKSGMKYFGYYTHDSTLSALLNHLQIFNKLKPPLASTLIFELYHYKREKYSEFTVLIRYRNDSTKDPYIMNLPFCSSLQSPDKYVYRQECSLTQLAKLLSPSFIRNLTNECQIDDYDDLINKATGFKLKTKKTLNKIELLNKKQIDSNNNNNYQLNLINYIPSINYFYLMLIEAIIIFLFLKKTRFGL